MTGAATHSSSAKAASFPSKTRFGESAVFSPLEDSGNYQAESLLRSLAWAVSTALISPGGDGGAAWPGGRAWDAMLIARADLMVRVPLRLPCDNATVVVSSLSHKRE